MRRSRPTLVFAPSLLPLVLGLLLAGSAGATVFPVTDGGDAGPGTLRDALTQAQSDLTATSASPHVIDFSALSPPVVISLASRITLHNTHVDLMGLGMADLVLDASGFSDTIFSVEDGSTMTLRAMTLQNASAVTSGGAVALDEFTALTAIDVFFFNNSSESGGAIRAGDNSMLVVTRCVFESNSTINDGGAINAGGGLGNSTTIENSIFRGNVASDALQTHGRGGGVIITDGSFTVVNSLFSGNGSVRSGSGLSIGPAATGSLLNSTLAGNVSGTGGALNVNGSLAMGNTIVARNLSLDPARDVDESTPTNTLGGNLIGDNTGAATTFPAGLPNANLDYVGTAAAPLDPLFRVDVPSTLTMPSTGGDLRLTGGVGVDGGIDAIAPPALPALGGNPRILGASVDIGAYEDPLSSFQITSDANDPSVTGESVTVTWSAIGTAGPPTGTVTVTDGASLATCSSDVATGSCNLVLPTAGARTLTAGYSGDATYASASDTEPHQVDPAATSTTITGFDPASAQLAGHSLRVFFAVAPVAPGAGTPTGQVTVADGSGATCTAPVAAGFCDLVTLAAGERAFVASYEGDGNFLPSESPPATIQVATVLEIPTLGTLALTVLGLLLAGMAVRRISAA